MGTKLNPGKYDCWGQLKENEPYFVLKANDPLAPIIVRFWVQIALFTGECSSAKAEEAQTVARDMEDWYKRYHFPDPEPPE